MAKNIVPFDLSIAQDLYDSSQDFPVDFDDAFAWWGALVLTGPDAGKPARKDQVRSQLVAQFEKDVDYIDWVKNSPENPGKIHPERVSGSGKGRPSRKIKLSVDCFKMFGMQIAGDRGREIRRYFIECEKRAKAVGTRRLSDNEIVRLCVLSQPTIHKTRFEQEYYDRLSELTNLQQDGHKRPKWWAQLTKEWVYDCLPVGITTALYQCREDSSGGGWEKLHQYLSEDGIAIFTKHMNELLRMMDYAGSVNDVRRMLQRKLKKHYQYELFEDCRKDGVISISRKLNKDESA